MAELNFKLKRRRRNGNIENRSEDVIIFLRVIIGIVSLFLLYSQQKLYCFTNLHDLLQIISVEGNFCEGFVENMNSSFEQF